MLPSRILLLPLLCSLACASSPKVAEVPQCDEPHDAISVADTATPSVLEVVPSTPEMVTLRLFVVDPGKPEGELPEPVQEADVCKAQGCSLLLAPMLLGRNRAPMELEVGTGKDANLFSMEAKPTLYGEHVQLELNARMFVDGDEERSFAQHFEFSGSLKTGQLTHVGTFHANDHNGHVVGPQVFAMVEDSTPN